MSQVGVRHSHQKSVMRASGFGGIGDLPTLPATRAHPDILPEHERDYPATPEVKAAILADWDGSGPSAHDIGPRFRSPVPNHPYPNYPGYRIEAIAWQMGVYDERRAALAHQAGQEERTGDSEKRTKSVTGGRRTSAIRHGVENVGASWRAPTRLFARQNTADVALARLEQAGEQTRRPALPHTFGDQLTHVLTSVRSLDDALARVDAQLASGDGDTNTLALLAIEREALADLAAERPGRADSGERTEQVMTAVIPVIPVIPTDAAGAVAAIATSETPSQAPSQAPEAAMVIEAPQPGVATQPRVYDKRQAVCEQCGQSFMSLYRGGKQGWTRYCSSGCGGKARWTGVKQGGERHAPTSAAPKAAARGILNAPPPSVAPLITAVDAPREPDQGQQRRAVTLTSGARVTLSVEGNILALNASERVWLFALIERLAEFERDSLGAQREAE